MGRAEDLFAEIKSSGETAINRLIEDRQTENLWLEFKRSANQGRSRKLHEDDWKNLAKAISGFGNSDGGVIVWGIHCTEDSESGDVPTRKYPIENLSRFVGWLENAISGCTIPPHPGVEHISVPTEGSEHGFVATLVPSSQLAPHQCVKPVGTFHYYIRAGSSFVPTPHAVLAGLFGRRPSPRVLHLYGGTVSYTAKNPVLVLNLLVSVFNDSSTIARDVFSSLIITTPKQYSNAHVSIDPNRTGLWIRRGVWILVCGHCE